jgi:hypothetical protein
MQAAPKPCFDFLGPSVTCLSIGGSKNTIHQKERKCGRRRKLSPLEEFVITLMRLRLGLFEEKENTNPFKGLIGATPSGAVSLVSPLYSGSISSKELTLESGLAALLEKEVNIMADRGFEVSDLLQPLGVHLNIPPFLRG